LVIFRFSSAVCRQGTGKAQYTVDVTHIGRGGLGTRLGYHMVAKKTTKKKKFSIEFQIDQSYSAKVAGLNLFFNIAF